MTTIPIPSTMSLNDIYRLHQKSISLRKVLLLRLGLGSMPLLPILTENQWMWFCLGYQIVSKVVRFPFWFRFLKYRKNAPTTGQVSKVQRIRDYVKISVAIIISFTGFYWGIAGKLSFAQWNINPSISYFGVLFGIFSLWFMYQAHAALGDAWSPIVSKQSKHQLKTNGVYAVARHPMYLAFYMHPVAIFLISQNWCYALTCSAWAFYAGSRMAEEERLMVKSFGKEYIEYKQRVGALFPWKPFGFDFGISMEEAKLILEK